MRRRLAAEIDAIPGMSVFRVEGDPRLADHRQDPLRLVVNVSGTGWSGYEVERLPATRVPGRRRNGGLVQRGLHFQPGR